MFAMHYVGLDVHAKRSSLCILDSCGKTVKQLEVKGTWPLLLERVAAEVPRPFSVCFEASCGYGYLHEKLSTMAHAVSVAHPGQLRLIFKSKKKNDRVDAGKLAKILYLDAVPAVHVPSVDVRAWRGLIECRRRLMDRRVAVKNQARALLRSLGIVALVAKTLWSKKGLAWLEAQTLSEADSLRRDLLVQELSELNQKIKRVEKELAQRGNAHPGVTLLRTIPGVGIRTAEAFVAYVDNVQRFSRNKKVASYLGLVPCQDSSAGKDRLGHITKDGPGTVRKMLCEAAWQGIRRSPSLKSFFDRVMGADPDRKKIALVATARHLAIIMAAMLRSGEVWREQTVVEEKIGKDGCADGDSASPLRKTPKP